MKKKSFDYGDHHYRDAIGRLKLMLADSYLPAKYASSSSIFKSVTDDETDTTDNTIIERPALRDISKFYAYKPYATYSSVSSYKPQHSLQPPSRTNKASALSNSFALFFSQWEATRPRRWFPLAALSRPASCSTSSRSKSRTSSSWRKSPTSVG